MNTDRLRTDGADLSGDPFPVCTHCGFTWGEYRARGLLGCSHCYAAFGDALQADIAWLHRALDLTAPAPAPETIAEWREKLADAVRAENYEEAARLRRLIQASPDGKGPVAEGAPGGGPGLGLG